jgi:hypothetical protein
MECDAKTQQGFSITPSDIFDLARLCFEKAKILDSEEIDLRSFSGYWDFFGESLFDINSDEFKSAAIGDLRWDLYLLDGEKNDELSDAAFVLRTLSMIIYAISLKLQYRSGDLST